MVVDLVYTSLVFTYIEKSPNSPKDFKCFYYFKLSVILRLFCLLLKTDE